VPARQRRTLDHVKAHAFHLTQKRDILDEGCHRHQAGRANASVVINDIGHLVSGEGGSAMPTDEMRAEINSFGDNATISAHSAVY
jgi:hypothetical protein